MERRDSSEYGTGSTGNDTGNSTGGGSRNTGGGSRNTGSGAGSSTGSSTRSCTRSTGTSTGSGSRNTLNGTGNNTGNYTGNYTGSGRAAPPGGPGRALLCLALLLPALPLPPARALPTPPRLSHPLAQCLNSSWGLLEAANTSLHLLKERDILGFNCTFEEMDLQDMTDNQINTISACTAEDPGPGNCPVLERSTFDEGKCLQGISEDLRAYRPHLSNLEDPQLLGALDALMEALGNCSGKDAEAPLGSGSSLGSSPGPSLGSSLGPSPGSSPGPSPGPSPGSSPGLARTPFSQRMQLCSALLAFRIRSVTISRMLNFLSSL